MRRTDRTSYGLLGIALTACLITCSGLDNISVEATGTTVISQRSVLDELLGSVAFTGLSDFDISQSQEFRNQGYTKEQVDSVRLEQLALTITAPDGANFDFLDRIAFFMEADGLPAVEIARLDPVPDGLSQLDLDIIDDVELQPYVIAPSLTITTEAAGVRPEQETTVDALVVLDVDINVTGGCE